MFDLAGRVAVYITSTDARSGSPGASGVERQESLLPKPATMDDAVEKYLNLTSYYGQQVEMTKQAPFAEISARHGQIGCGSCSAGKVALPGGS